MRKVSSRFQGQNITNWCALSARSRQCPPLSLSLSLSLPVSVDAVHLSSCYFVASTNIFFTPRSKFLQKRGPRWHSSSQPKDLRHCAPILCAGDLFPRVEALTSLRAHHLTHHHLTLRFTALHPALCIAAAPLHRCHHLAAVTLNRIVEQQLHCTYTYCICHCIACFCFVA